MIADAEDDRCHRCGTEERPARPGYYDDPRVYACCCCGRPICTGCADVDCDLRGEDWHCTYTCAGGCDGPAD